MDHCVVAFIREKRDISQLWKVRDPYLNAWILNKCGVNRIDKVTMTDLIETFMPQVREGRDCSRYDRPQLASRTNEGFFDRKVRETWTARARKTFGDIIKNEKDTLMTPPQSPRLEQNDTDMEIDEQALEELLEHQSILDIIRENDKREVARVKFVSDCKLIRLCSFFRLAMAGPATDITLQCLLSASLVKYDPKNPGHAPPPRRLTTREFMAIDTLKHLKEGLEFDSDDDSDEYSHYGDEYESNDEVMSVDEHLPNERKFDGPSSGNDYGNKDIEGDGEGRLRVVAQVPKGRESLSSKRMRPLSDDVDDESEKEEVLQPSRMENPLQERPRSRSPSSGPLTSKHFDFVMASETPPQSHISVESARVMEGDRTQPQIFGTHPEYLEASIHSGKINGRFILLL